VWFGTYARKQTHTRTQTCSLQYFATATAGKVTIKMAGALTSCQQAAKRDGGKVSGNGSAILSDYKHTFYRFLINCMRQRTLLIHEPYVLVKYFPALEKLCRIHLRWLNKFCHQHRQSYLQSLMDTVISTKIKHNHALLLFIIY